MTDTGPDQADDSGLDDALRELRAAHSWGRPDVGLEARIFARVAETRQRRRLGFVPTWSSDPWPASRRTTPLVAIGSLGLVGVVIAAVIGVSLLAPHSATGSPAPIGASALPSAPPADAPASNPPHVGGTCPLTPITRLAGGVAPEVDVSGLRWRWGGVPWVAGMPEKVVWLADSGDEPPAGVSIYATQLDLPTLVGGHPVSTGGTTDRSVYAIATDTGWVDLLQLPRPGFWLLTAIWSPGASSVVVAAAPSPGRASPAPSTIGPVVTPLDVCPATPRSTLPAPQGSSVYVDGPFRWLLGSSENFRIGGEGDKLVLDSDLGWGAGDKRVIAFPLARAAGVGRLPGSAVVGDTPPIDGGTMGVGITLPSRDCWAFIYLDAGATSTIVDDLVSVTPSASLSADGAMALAAARLYETARAGGQWSVAWALLSGRSQATIGSLASFAAIETAYNAQGGTTFLLQVPTQDANLVATFLGASQAAIASEAETSRGFLVSVQHHNVTAASAGTTALYVAPLRSGGWRIWLVH
jgi:hypothetical protein